MYRYFHSDSITNYLTWHHQSKTSHVQLDLITYLSHLLLLLFFWCDLLCPMLYTHKHTHRQGVNSRCNTWIKQHARHLLSWLVIWQTTTFLFLPQEGYIDRLRELNCEVICDVGCHLLNTCVLGEDNIPLHTHIGIILKWIKCLTMSWCAKPRGGCDRSINTDRLAFRSCPTGPAGRGWSSISTSGCWGRLYSRQRSQMSFFNCCKSLGRQKPQIGAYGVRQKILDLWQTSDTLSQSWVIVIYPFGIKSRNITSFRTLNWQLTY